MQRTLYFTYQQYSRASSSTPSLSNSRSTRLLSSLVARRPRGSTASTPLIIDDTSEPNKQNNSISREPPPASQNYGCIFLINQKNLFLGKHGRLTSYYRYRVINKRSLLKTAFILPIQKYRVDLFQDRLKGRKRLQLYKTYYLA